MRAHLSGFGVGECLGPVGDGPHEVELQRDELRDPVRLRVELERRLVHLRAQHSTAHSACAREPAIARKNERKSDERERE